MSGTEQDAPSPPQATPSFPAPLAPVLMMVFWMLLGGAAGIKLAQSTWRLRAEADNLKHALEDRKIIERAKGILMDRANLSEPDAFRRLQLLSSQKNKKMVEIAQTIVDAELAFRPE